MNHELVTIPIEQRIYPPLDFETVLNPWGPSPKLMENQERIGSVSEESLRRSIGDWLSLHPRTITLGAQGSTEIINLIPKLFIRPASPCVIVTPTYFGLYKSLKNAGNTITVIKTHENSGFAYDNAVVSNLFKTTDNLNPSLLWLCTPNNPTGVSMDPAVIDKLAQQNPNTLIVVDEAYQEIIDPKNKKSMVRQIDTRNNILVTKTFSKAWGLADIRIGIAIGHESLINTIRQHNHRPPIGEASLALAEAALLDTDHLDMTQERMKQELSFIQHHISAMKHISLGSQSETGVCLMKHDAKNLGEALALRNISSLDCDKVRDLEGLGYVRISLQTHEKNMQLMSHLWQLDSQL